VATRGARNKEKEGERRTRARGEIRYGETSVISRNEIAPSRAVVVDDISKSMSYEGLSSSLAHAPLIARMSLPLSLFLVALSQFSIAGDGWARESATHARNRQGMAADKSTRPGEREREAKYAAADLKLQPAECCSLPPKRRLGERGGERDPRADLRITAAYAARQRNDFRSRTLARSASDCGSL